MKWVARSVKRRIRRALEDFENEVVEWLNEHLDIPGRSESEEEQIFRAIYQKLGDLIAYVIDLGITRLKKRRR